MNINTVREILNNLHESTRKSVERIITGEVTHQIVCHGCGRVVAEMLKDGKIDPTVDANGQMWLLAFRHRLDGFLGLQCLCGNDSRLCEHEKGVRGIVQNQITKKEIETVLGKIERKPSVYPIIKGKQLIDNFSIIKTS